jgi:hypothetical protein
MRRKLQASTLATTIIVMGIMLDTVLRAHWTAAATPATTPSIPIMSIIPSTLIIIVVTTLTIRITPDTTMNLIILIPSTLIAVVTPLTILNTLTIPITVGIIMLIQPNTISKTTPLQ